MLRPNPRQRVLPNVGPGDFGAYGAGLLDSRKEAGSDGSLRVLCETGAAVDITALSAELEALGRVHPELAGQLTLAATTIDEQKKELVGMLGEMAKVEAMMRELYGEINACRGKSADGADGALGKQETTVLEILQGLAAGALDDMEDDADDAERGELEPAPLLAAPAPLLAGPTPPVLGPFLSPAWRAKFLGRPPPPPPPRAPLAAFAPPPAPPAPTPAGDALAPAQAADAPRPAPKLPASHPVVQGAAALSGFVGAPRADLRLPPVRATPLQLQRLRREVDLWARAVGALPRPEKGPRRPHADGGPHRVLRDPRRRLRVRGQGRRGPGGRRGPLLARLAPDAELRNRGRVRLCWRRYRGGLSGRKGNLL